MSTPQNTDAGRRKIWKRPLPPRYLWPRTKQPKTARRACPECGELDRAVSSRELITYYGPTRCAGCGRDRPLRKVERPIDWVRLGELYHLPPDVRRRYLEATR